MRICLLTQPGRGDTEPFVALAVRLRQLGHRVTLASRPDLAPLADEHGIDFVPVGNPYRPFIDAADRAGAMGPGHPIAKLSLGLRQRNYVTENLHSDAWKAAQGADLIVYKYPWLTAHTIAEKLAIPSVAVMLLPFLPTRSFPSFVTGGGIDRGVLLNRLVWTAPWQAIWVGLRQDDKKLRGQFALPALPIRAPVPLRESDQTPVLGAWSEAVLPQPTDWPDQVHLTGYWFLDPPPSWQPPTALVEFLASGPPPISIGFGSMGAGDRDATWRTVLDALELSRQRGLLLAGWGEMPRATSPNVFCVQDVPHAWLFPQVAAAVHHGGAGTTAAALRAGIPAIVAPLVADQPSWARTVESLGAGPPPIPFRKLTPNRLAGAIQQAITDPGIRQRARDISDRLRSEDGVGRAAELVTNYAKNRQRK
jgi:sterol 3beta-glucosyltransferase